MSTLHECPVCYEDVELIKFHCSHHLCYGCYQKINKPRLCPLCRFEMVDLDLVGSTKNPEPQISTIDIATIILPPSGNNENPLINLLNQASANIHLSAMQMEAAFDELDNIIQLPENTQTYQIGDRTITTFGGDDFLNNLMREFSQSYRQFMYPSGNQS